VAEGRGGERTGAKGKGREGREGDKEEGREFVLCPRKKKRKVGAYGPWCGQPSDA